MPPAMTDPKRVTSTDAIIQHSERGTHDGIKAKIPREGFASPTFRME